MSAVKTYSTDLFTWTREKATFSAEVSDLSVKPGDSAVGALTDDTLTGLSLMNPKTGGTMEFRISHVEFSIENELLWWTLTQTPIISGSQTMTVIVYND